MDELRQLTPAGITEMREFISALRAGEQRPVPDLLWGARSSEPVRPAVDISPHVFDTKYALGEHLTEILEPLPATSVDGNGALWSWLALYYFDVVCPARSGGQRRARADGLYVLTPDAARDFRRYYRHLLMSSYVLTRRHGEFARVALSGRPDQHGDMQEQLASRLEIASNRGLFEVAYRLYFDVPQGRVKRGATDRNRAGSVRRLIGVIQQLDLTYDLYGMSADEILAILPDEFETWVV